MRSRKKRATSARQSGSDAIESSVTNDVIAGIQVAAHDTTVMGLGNVNRDFVRSDETNGPSVIIRGVYPFQALTHGFTKSDISAQDTDAGLTLGDAGVTIYPVTEAAKNLERDVFPVITQLLESGTGSRTSVSFSDFARYTNIVIAAYTAIRDVISMNTLAYHYDWTSVYPFTDAVPPLIYEYATASQATDVDLADQWLPLIRRLETKVMFPRVMEEIKRQMTPMTTPSMGGRLLVPLNSAVLSSGQGSILLAKVKTWLDELDSPEYSKIGAVLNSFIPFNVGNANPWAFDNFGDVDLNRESGWWNSSPKQIDAFGDTGDPSTTYELTIHTDGEDGPTTVPALIHTIYPQPTWGEIKNMTIMNLQEEAVDDTYRLLTMHKYGNIKIYSDVSPVTNPITYGQTTFTTASDEYYYERFANCRWTNNGSSQGRLRPESMGAEIPYITIKRMVRQETRFLFSIELLSVIALELSGASLREVRRTIRDATNTMLSSGH